jgi:outer membrane immunogenic protein
MKKIAIAIVALAALFELPAQAADMALKAPPALTAAPFSWAGFYIGLNGGGAAGHSCWTYVTASIDGGCADPSGGVLGGQIGYNWQNGNWVTGVEAQGDWAHLRGSNAPASATQITDHTNISALYMATARVGYAWDRVLLYVKGGAALVPENYFATCNGLTAEGICDPAGFTPWANSENRLGGVVGVGLEYGLTQNVSLGVEGSYLPLGTRNDTFSPSPGYTCGVVTGVPCTIAVRENLWLVTGRLNWRFATP